MYKRNITAFTKTSRGTIYSLCYDSSNRCIVSDQNTLIEIVHYLFPFYQCANFLVDSYVSGVHSLTVLTVGPSYTVALRVPAQDMHSAISTAFSVSRHDHTIPPPTDTPVSLETPTVARASASISTTTANVGQGSGNRLIYIHDLYEHIFFQ